MAARFRVLDVGTLRDIKNMFVMQGGVLRRCKTLKGMHDNVLRTVGVFAPPLSIAISGTQTSETLGLPPSVVTQHLAQITATPVGGAGPFTYSWTLTAGGGWVASGLSTATLGLSAVRPVGEPPPEATYSVLVTDALGQTATTSVSI